MKKKLISLLTALSMIFMLFGTPNISAETAGNCDGTHSGMSAWTHDDYLPTSGNYYLDTDVNLSSCSYSTGSLTLCLNGHTITAASGKQIFSISGSLTLCDCSSGKTGKLSGSNVSDSGGAVDVTRGTFTMNGGTISGNTAGTGGGVFVRSGASFIMNGGTISNNITSSNGGGVYSSGIFTMNGGTISDNTTNSNAGGGVFVAGSGTFIMNGGMISSNTADIRGGGVYVNGGTFTMSGGIISGNTTANSGGGVGINGTFEINGKVNISGNTKTDGSDNNVYLFTGKKISIGNDFNTSSTIGVNTEAELANCQGYVDVTETCSDVSNSFKADIDGQNIVYNSGKVQLTKHNYSTATCKDKAVCTICGEAYGDFAAHTIMYHAAVPANCTTAGNDAYWECSVCNKIFSDESGTTEIGAVPTIPVLEHNYVDGTCTECGGTDPTYTPPHEHDYVNGECTECGAKDPTYVPPHEHNYVNGKCECGETDPTYNRGSVTEDVNDTAGTSAGLVQNNTLIENVLTAEEKTAVENGHSFKIVLEVTDIINSVSPADAAAASSALKSGEEIGVYVDLSLYKIKDNDTANRTPIHSANGQIGITLKIPDNIYAAYRTYSIIRVHNNVAENLGGTYDRTNNTLTFYTDKFSTYAIAFTASTYLPTTPTTPVTPTAPTIPTTPTNPATPSAPVVTPNVTEAEVIYDDPYFEDVSSAAGIYENDGSDSNIHYVLIVVFTAAAGISIIAAKKRFGKRKIK